MDSISVQSASTNSEPDVQTQISNTKIVNQSPSLKQDIPAINTQAVINNRKYNCPSKTDEQYKAQSKQMDDYLLHSRTPEVKQLLTITEYNPDKETRMSLGKLSKEERKQHDNKRINKLALSMADFPGNKLLNITLMNACIANPENENCSSANIDKALALDGNNGVLLSKIAALFYKKGDKDKAIYFLQNSANVPLFNDYRKERIRLFINALKPIGWTMNDVTVAAIGMEAAIGIGDLSITYDLCLSGHLEDIIQTCIAYGKRLELDASIIVLNSIGLKIQKVAFKHIANSTSEEETDRKIEKLRQSLEDIIFTEQLFHDDNFVNDWITTITNYNEIESFRRMKKEAERLMADPDYTPCPKE